MKSALPLALLCASGCDLVYGLGDRIEPDAAMVDAPDAAPDIDSSIPCTNYSNTVTAVADTMLMRDAGGCNPSIRLGTYDNINLGQTSVGTRSRLLMRFSLTNEMIAALQPDGGFTEAALTFPLKPAVCNGPCASSPLSFSVHAANNDWNEGQASGNIGAGWCERKQLAPGSPMNWIMAGADGVGDRSMMSLGEFSINATQAAQNQLVVRSMPSAAVVEDARTWVAGAQLSILVVPTAGANGILYVKAHEVANGGGVQLTIKSCR